eukprot:g6509.t1
MTVLTAIVVATLRLPLHDQVTGEPNYDSLSNRLSVAITVLLTAVAFQFTLEGKLPVTATVTLIDVYFIASYMGVAVVIVCSIFGITSSSSFATAQEGPTKQQASFVLDMVALTVTGFLYVASTANLFSGYCRRPPPAATTAKAGSASIGIPFRARM